MIRQQNTQFFQLIDLTCLLVYTPAVHLVAVAQLVEHRIVVPSVVGSIPISHPTFAHSLRD